MGKSIKEIEASEVRKWHEAGEIVLVDVRELLEYNEEHLAKAHLFPMSNFKPELLPDPIGKKLLFYCQLGLRSSGAALKWAEYAGVNEAFCLKGGVAAWKNCGFSTVHDSATSRRIESQTYALSGILVLTGIICALFISNWFLLLPAAVAVLLVLSGIMGHCLFSFFLSMFPWNR